MVEMCRGRWRSCLFIILFCTVGFLSLYRSELLISSSDDDYEEEVEAERPKIPLKLIKDRLKELYQRKTRSNLSVIDYYLSIGYSKCDKSSTGLYSPWLSLKSPANQSCQFYFDTSTEEHLKTSDKNISVPPAEIPDNFEPQYSMDGLIDTSVRRYFNNRYNGELTSYQWTRGYLNLFMYKAEIRSIDFNYFSDTDAIYFALLHYNLTNKSGLVFGSENPWLEAILLVHGKVAKVITVEYHPINISVSSLGYIHPLNLSENWRETARLNLSFAFTFSSFEHSGLGRYGDPLNPDGDLLEMRKISCLLPTGSLVFLGVPVGPDKVVWNAHRIYGPYRLPLLTANYELMAVFGSRGKVENHFEWLYERFAAKDRPYKHYLLVLKNKGCQ